MYMITCARPSAGLVLLPGVLSPEQQTELATAALAALPQPPARTNHDRQYGPLTGSYVT